MTKNNSTGFWKQGYNMVSLFCIIYFRLHTTLVWTI